MDPSFTRALEKIHPRLRVDAFRFVPILNGSKKPEGVRWSTDANYPYNHAVMAGYLAEGHNFGVLTGVGGLVVLDIDDLARLEALGIIGTLPETFTVRTGRGGLHYYLLCSELREKIILEDPELIDDDGDALHLGELQALGQQCVCPGSRHPNGNFYEAIKDLPIATITKADLMQILSPLKQIDIKGAEEKRASRRSSGGSYIGDIIPIDSICWPKNVKERAGAEVRGSHPIHGSESGKNFAVNTSKNCWHCFRHKSGGGPLEWLAVEAGLISCQDAKPGCLDKEAFKKVLQIAREKGFGIPEPKAKEEPKGPTGEAPKLQTVSKDDPKGTVGLNPATGAICKADIGIGDDGEEYHYLRTVSDCAVHIHTETRAKDETEFIFVGRGAVDKRDVKFTMKAGDVMEGRKFRAALTNAFGAKNQIGGLTFPIVQRISLNPRLLQRVEVPTWSGDTPLLPGVGLADDVEYRLSSKIPAAVYDGDIDEAKDILRTLLKVHKYAPIVLDVVLGAPAIARHRGHDRFGLGIWGQTGTLKTSMALAAMGVYGIGYLDGPKLKAGKAGSTVNGAMEIFAAAGFLPQLYDNVKAVDSKDAENYVSTMHAVLEGEEKARGRKDGGLRESREFSCTPINTGEVRTQEASTTTRIFNLNWTRADEELLSGVQQNAALLPVIGYHWLRFLAGTDYVFGKDFEAFRAKKFEEFLGLKYVNPGRLATIYTLLVSTWDMLEASPLGEAFVEARESFKAVLEEATAIQGQAASEETEIARFLSGLEELIASNPGLIMSKEGKKVIAGSIIGKRTDQGLFLLPSETLHELGKIKVFNQQPTIDSITQGLHERGILIRGEKDKLKTRLRIGEDRVYGWHVVWSPVEGTTVPPQKGQENDNERRSVPGVPGVHDIREKVNSQEKIENFSEDEKTFVQMAGDRGDRGDKEEKRERDRDIDSVFSSRVVSPVVSPVYSKIERETPTKPTLSEPKEAIDESVPGKIRIAAISEYGQCGWVDPRKIATKLHIELEAVEAWLQAQSNYVRTPSGNGYTQRSKAEAA